MNYEKIIKWVLLALFVIGVIFSFYGFAVGFEKNDAAAVDSILYCAYAFVGITILAVLLGVVVIGGINNPKSLIKLLIGLVAIVVLVGGAWILAPGTPAIGYMGEPVSDFNLKLTDATLSLTYLLCGAAIISLIVGAIVSATRK